MIFLNEKHQRGTTVKSQQQVVCGTSLIELTMLKYQNPQMASDWLYITFARM